jgi:hypothetical protein
MSVKVTIKNISNPAITLDFSQSDLMIERKTLAFGDTKQIYSPLTKIQSDNLLLQYVKDDNIEVYANDKLMSKTDSIIWLSRLATGRSKVGLLVDAQANTTLTAGADILAEANTLSLADYTTTDDWQIHGAGNKVKLEYTGSEPKTFRFEMSAVIRKGVIGSGRIITVFLVKNGVTANRIGSFSFVSRTSAYPDSGAGMSNKIEMSNGDTIALYLSMNAGGSQIYQVSQNSDKVIIYAEQI